jgi:hypothetical protein
VLFETRSGKEPHDNFSCALGQWHNAICFRLIKLFPGRTPCAARAPPAPCTSHRSVPRS